VIREASDLLNERPLPGHVVPEGQRPTSDMGHFRTWAPAIEMSVLPSKADWTSANAAGSHAYQRYAPAWRNHTDSRWLGPRPLHTVDRVGAQIAEECFDLARERCCGRGQVAGGGEDGSCGRAGLAHGVAERADIDHQRAVALRRQLRVLRDFAGREILLFDGPGDSRGHIVDFAHRVADFANGVDRIPGRGLDQADVLADLGGRLGGLLDCGGSGSGRRSGIALGIAVTVHLIALDMRPRRPLCRVHRHRNPRFATLVLRCAGHEKKCYIFTVLT
jgi:hypothetical protein